MNRGPCRGLTARLPADCQRQWQKPQKRHKLCEKAAIDSELASGCRWGLLPCVMAHMTGEDRSQLLLLPDAVEDDVGPDNPVRFIDAFVDGLDLEAAGFQRVQPSDKGRPGYDPADLLKLYIYGYQRSKPVGAS